GLRDGRLRQGVRRTRHALLGRPAATPARDPPRAAPGRAPPARLLRGRAVRAGPRRRRLPGDPHRSRTAGLDLGALSTRTRAHAELGGDMTTQHFAPARADRRFHIAAPEGNDTHAWAR